MTYEEIAGLRAEAERTRAEQRRLQAVVDELVAGGATPAEIVVAARAVRRAAAAAAAADARYRSALAATVTALEPDVPLLLLPVRLETRFRPATSGAGVDLLIRIYPDDIHLDSHEPGLLASEVQAGQRYWLAVRNAESTAERSAAWAQLTTLAGPNRAVWIRRTLTPTNAATPGVPPTFPTPAQQASRWTRAVRAEALPDHWTAVAFRDGTRIAQADGGLITRPLAAGPSPVDTAELTDPAMRWMVDFSAAQDAGMSLVLPLTAAQADRIDLLAVLGVRGTTGPVDSAGVVAKLLAAHRYTWGADLVPVSTPTNNTPQARAGRSVQSAPAAGTGAAGSDLEILAAALGAGSVVDLGLDSVPHAGQRDQEAAADMATLLWSGTWGYYLSQVLRPVFGDQSVDGWRRWFTSTVRARGPLPALRIGDQPYGLLPVTSLDRWRQYPDQPELLLLCSVTDGGPPSASLGALWDLDAAGAWTDTGDPVVLEPPAWAAAVPGSAIATGLATADLDDDGHVEVVVGWLAADGSRAGYSIFRLNTDGQPGVAVAEGEVPIRVTSTAMALALVPGVTGTDLVVFLQHEARVRPGAGPAQLTVQTGAALGVDGSVQQWSNPVGLAAVEADERLLGAAVVDIDGDGQVEYAVLVDAAGTVRYRVGGGSPARPTWSAPVEITPGGVPSTAGGIVFADVDHDGALELVIAHFWDAGGLTGGSYRVGYDLDPAGRPGRWSGPYNTGSALPGQPVGGGIALASVGRSRRPGWTSTAGRIAVLNRLRDVWLDATGVPRVGAQDPDQALLELLATDATTASVALRPLIGPVLAASLWLMVNEPLAPTYQSDLGQRLLPALTDVALAGTPRLASLAFAPEVAGVAPIGGVSTSGLLREMAEADPQQLHDQWAGADLPLLARLARHSLLQAYADAAWQLVPVPVDGPPPPPEPELVDLADITGTDPATPTHTLTSWRHLTEAVYQGAPVATVLHKAAHAANPIPEAVPVAEALAAARRLAELAEDDLNRLLLETLDLASHRLDAALTAVATNRLRELRQRRTADLHLGGYGFVTDLQPTTGPASTGYVHAPSIGHAATAAVLRSGYLTHSAAALAVDLSSTRARLAIELLDGIRSGQSLGALLGYRFERELTDRGLAQYLPLLRQLAPEVVGQLTDPPPGTAVEAASALATVDGLTLLRHWTDDAIPWGSGVQGQSGLLPAKGTPAQIGVVTALAAVQDAADAVADVGMAESVHQLLQGNQLRSGGSLDALGRGDLPPPEPEVLSSPRTGVALTHRMLVLIDAKSDSEPLAAWTGTQDQEALWLRAAAEPRLNQWAAAVLGDPARVRFRVGFADPTTGLPTADAEHEFALRAVGWCPLDLLYGPAPSVASLDETDLGRRLLGYAVGKLPALPAGLRPVLRSGRAQNWAADVLSMEELLTLAELARDLVGGARAATAQDLVQSGVRVSTGINEDELADRATAAVGAMTTAVAELHAPFALGPGEAAGLRATLGAADIGDQLGSLLDLPAHVDVAAACAALDRPALATLGAVRAPLVTLSAFGVDGAAPRSVGTASADARAELAHQARDAGRVAAGRLAAADAAAGDNCAVLEALFGPGFVVLPVFDPANAKDLDAATTLRSAAADAGPAEVATWFEGVARVRTPVRRLHDVLLASRAVGNPAPRQLAALQLPVRAGDPWLASTLPPGATMPGGLTGLTITADAWQPGARQAGLVIDEWVEVVPNDEETTGLVFHYDAPGASAPQALLLAVSPDPTRPWDLPTLEAIILETVEAARIRAVQPQHLAGLGHLLPALLLARNVGGDPAGDTISTAFEG